MNNIDASTPPSSYGTSGYFSVPVIELEKWQLKRRLDSDIPGHYLSMVFHQCKEAPWETYMNGLRESLTCTFCQETMPDEIQVIWTFMNHDLLE